MKKNAENSLESILSPVSSNLKILEEQLIQSFSEKNTLINNVAKYILDSGGKRIRPALVFLFAKMANELNESHYELAKAVEIIHNATLIHDDIIDESDLRRNNMVAHKRWDTKTAVLAGDYLLAKALKSLAKTNSIESLEIFSSAMEEICEGEVEQNLNPNLISFDDYIQRIIRKTAMLFSCATQNAVSENKNHAKDYAINLGIAFQITDDLLVFEEGFKDKSADVDFNNNLITAPALFALEEGVKLNFDATFEQFKQQIISSNAIQKSRNLALKYANKAIQSLDVFKDNEYKQSLIALVNHVVSREI